MKRGALAIGVALLLAVCVGVDAHQSLSLAVPIGELGDAPAPLRGSNRFFADAVSLLRPRCDADQNESLDEISRLLGEAERVRWGAVPGADPRVADHLRAKAEQRLLTLVATFRDTVSINLAEAEARLVERDLDPQHNSVLVTVTAGDGPPEFAVVDWDLTGEAFDRTTTLEVAPRGTTHAWSD